MINMSTTSETGLVTIPTSHQSTGPTSIHTLARGKALQSAMSFVKSLPSHALEMPTSPQQMNRGSPFHSRYPLSPCNLHQVPMECICNRAIKTILCRCCGMTCKGRVRITCIMHPNNVHLMDLECCPSCKASQIKEFTESENKRNV